MAWLILAVLAAIFVIVDFKVTGYRHIPISVWMMGMIFSALGTTALRFGFRFLRFISRTTIRVGKNHTNVMVIGAGACGKEVIHEYTMSEHLTAKVCCLIDDNPIKKGRTLDGVPIVGNRNDIPKMVGKYDIDEIVFAIPDARGVDKKDILDICSATGCKVRVIPGIYQMIEGSVKVSALRDVQIEDLLGRDPVKANMKSIRQYITGKTVMVTGGGGSIGSELCRQIIKQDPKMLVVLDIYENTAYDLQQELKYHYPDKDMRFVIGSVRDLHRLDVIFEKYHPQLVFHAAAHKHVPLMEHSPNEAIKNNVFGTYNVALTAEKYEVEKFVLISTDKAVNPTNIMGASKRICEMIIQTMAKYSKTTFVAVRFGNVLGSHGSVIPLFERQIKAGGPVTVTHPDIIRFFMTIPEAVGLVLQAGAYAKGGEIFVLDMGEPMKILDLAKNMIRMSGYIPDEDIKIEFTGLRPGEKLYEEVLMDEEGLTDTENEMIHIGKPIALNEEVFFEQLRELREATRKDLPTIKKVVADIVPTYTPQTITPKHEKEL